MNRILQSILKEMSIKRKLLVLFALFVVLPVLLLSFYFSNSLANNTLEGAYRFYSSSMEQLKFNIVDRLTQYCNIMVATAGNQDIVSFMATSFSNDLETYIAYKDKVMPVLERIQLNDVELNYFLYTDKVYQLRISSFIDDHLTDHEMFSEYKASQRNKLIAIQWLGMKDIPPDDKKALLFNFPIMDFNSHGSSLLGLLLFELDEDNLYSLMNMEGTAGKNVIVVMDEQDQIITGTIRELVGHDGAEFIGSLINTGDNRIKIYNGKTYISLVSSINKGSIGINHWKINFMIPYEQVQQSIKSVWRTGFIIALMCILVSCSVIILYLNNFSQRIKRLVTNFKTVGKGDFTVKVADDGKDEIAMLDRNFQKMVFELNNLIQQVYSTQLQLKEAELESQIAINLKKNAELKALQNQINPHYLFNTLESIRMNLIIKGEVETADIVEVFSESFRNNLYGHGDNIRICEELNFVEKYLLIQKYRYGDKIVYTIHVEKGLEDNYIPKFILQPLIENSIYHGLELKQGRGSLDVDIVRMDDDICISIIDDGIGMDEDTIQSVVTGAETGSVEGGFSAIANIQQRLKLMFGDQYKMIIRSQKGAYTRVYVYIPYNYTLNPIAAVPESPN